MPGSPKKDKDVPRSGEVSPLGCEAVKGKVEKEEVSTSTSASTCTSISTTTPQNGKETTTDSSHILQTSVSSSHSKKGSRDIREGPTFTEYIGSGRSLRDIYSESCKRYGCKRNSGLYELLSGVPGEYGTLHDIDLSNNVIGCKGVISLLQVVSVCRSIKRLGLKGNSLDHRCVLHIVDVAKVHKSLQQIDLSHNRIGTCGKPLNELLRVNSCITDICLDSTYIDAYMLKRIHERLTSNRLSLLIQKEQRKTPSDPSTDCQMKPSEENIITTQPDTLPEPEAPPPPPPPPPPPQEVLPPSPPPPPSPSPTTHTPTPPKPAPKESEQPIRVSDASEAESLTHSVIPEELSRVWWDAAVPIDAGEGFQPAPQLEGHLDLDWAAFPLGHLFKEKEYDRFLPVAAKLLQMATVSEPVKGWTSPSTSAALRESLSLSGSSDGMSVLDYSDATSLNQSVESADDTRSVHTSEFSEDELGEAQSPLPELHMSDDETNPPAQPEVAAPLPLTSPDGVGTADVVSLPPRQLEAHLARGVVKLGQGSNGQCCYESLHEKRLAVLNLIFSAAIPRLLKSTVDSVYVQTLPPQLRSVGHFRRPRRGSEGLRTESERMDLLFALIDHASSAPIPGVTETMSRAVLSALEGMPPFALSSSALSPPLPQELVVAVQGFLGTTGHALCTESVNTFANRDVVLQDIATGLVKLAVARGDLRDVLSAVSLLRRLPPATVLKGLETTFDALRSVVPQVGGLRLPFVASKPTWSTVVGWPSDAPPEVDFVCAISDDMIAVSKGFHLLVVSISHQRALRVASCVRVELPVRAIVFVNNVLLVRVAGPSLPTQVVFHRFSVISGELVHLRGAIQSPLPLGQVYGFVPASGSAIAVGEDPETRAPTLCEWDADNVPHILPNTFQGHCGTLRMAGVEGGVALGARSGRYSFISTNEPSAPIGSQRSVLRQGASQAASHPAAQLTVELWCKLTPAGCVSPIRLLSFSSYANEVQILLTLAEGGTTEVRAGHILGRGAAACVEIPTALLLDWCHLCMVYKAHSWHLLINGEMVATSPPCAAAPKLQDRGCSVGVGLRGMLMELRVWDIARSVSEVQRDMCSTLSGSEANLASYFPMNEGHGSLLTDRVSFAKLQTAAEVSTAWEDDACMVGVSMDEPIEWSTSTVGSPVQRTQSTPAHHYFVLPRLSQQQPCRVFGRGTRACVVFPEECFPFGELLRAAKGSATTPDPAMVLYISQTGTSLYWRQILPTRYNIACNSCAVVELPNGSLTCVSERSEGVASFTLIEGASGQPLCRWPDVELATATGLTPDACTIEEEALRNALPDDEIQDGGGVTPGFVVKTLLTTSLRFMDTAQAGEGLCFSVTFVTDVAGPTFKLLAEGASSEDPFLRYTCLRLATVNLNMLLRAKVSPSAVGLGGESCSLSPLLDHAKSVLDEGEEPKLVLLAAKALLCAYVPIMFPETRLKVEFVIETLPVAEEVGVSKRTILLGVLREVGVSVQLGALLRDEHLRCFDGATTTTTTTTDPAQNKEKQHTISLALAEVLLSAVGVASTISKPLHSAACTLLLHFQRYLASLALALHRTRSDTTVSTWGGEDASPRPMPPHQPDEGLFFMKLLFFPYFKALCTTAVVTLQEVFMSAPETAPQVLSEVFSAFVDTLPLLNGYAEEFLKGLSPLLPLFAKAGSMPLVLESERKLHEGELSETRTVALSRVITGVSRPGDAPQTQKVCVPGATSLALSFDPQCFLNGETLICHLPGKDPEAEGEQLGTGRRWPETPLVFVGTDTMIFLFDPSTSKSEGHISENRGFRITVTGQVPVLYPSLQWLHDVALNVLHSTSWVCQALISSYSVPCTPIDEALSPWIAELSLDADTAGEPHPFWQSIIQNTGAGGKLVASLQRKSHPTAQPHLGGEGVNQTLRAIFAALACHMGINACKFEELVNTGEDFPRATVRLWRRVDELRHWLIELRQKSRNTKTDDDDKLSPTHDPVAEALGRAMVLLRHPPPREVTTSLRAADGLANPLMATGTMAELMRSESTPEMRKMSSMFRKASMGGSVVMSRLRRMIRKSRNATVGTTQERREAAVLQFCQDERITAALFDEFVTKKKLLGRRRLAALACFERMIFEYSAAPRGSTEGDLSSEDTPPPPPTPPQPSLPSANSGLVRAFIRSIKGHHYLDNLACCGREVETAIQTNVYSIVSRLAARLRGGGSCVRAERLELFLDLMSCAWKGTDYALVLKLDVLQTFQKVFTNTESETVSTSAVATLRAKAWHVLQLLALRAAMEAGSGPGNSNDFSFGDSGLPVELERDETKAEERPEKDEEKKTLVLEQPEAESDGESDSGRDCPHICFLKKVVGVAVAELEANYAKLLGLHERQHESKRRLSRLRSRLDEAEHRMRVDRLYTHIMNRHNSGSSKRKSKQRTSPEQSAPSSPQLSRAREFRQRLKSPLRREREALQKLQSAISVHSGQVCAWLAFVTSLTITAPAVLVDLVMETGCVKESLRLLVDFDPRQNAAVCRSCFSFLRLVLPYISPGVADSTVNEIRADAPPSTPLPEGAATVHFLINFASRFGVPQLHQRRKIVRSYLGFTIATSTSRLIKILAQQPAWTHSVLHIIGSTLSEGPQCWLRKKPDGTPLVPILPDTAVDGDRSTPKAMKKRRSSIALNRRERKGTFEADADQEGPEASDSPARPQSESDTTSEKRRRKSNDDESVTSASPSEGVESASDREARKKARKIQRRRSRMQRRIGRDSDEAEFDSCEATDADGFTRFERRHQTKLDIALEVLGGGEVRVQEGRLAVCRLRRAARQHVIVQRIDDLNAVVVPVTAKGSFLASNGIKSKETLVDIEHNPPREVHTDRLIVGVSDMLSTAKELPNPTSIITPLCDLIFTILEPATALSQIVTYHPPAEDEGEPLLRLPTLKLGQLKRRLAFSRLLPSLLRALYAAVSNLPAEETGRIASSKILPLLMRLCSLRVETSDPVPFQHLGEMCALINYVLPHRSHRVVDMETIEEEEEDDVSDRDEYDPCEEEEEGEDPEEDDDMPNVRPQLHRGGQDHILGAEVWEEGSDHLAEEHYEEEGESCGDIPDIISEYNFATFHEGTDDGLSEEDAWEGCSDANDSDEEDAYVIFKRTEVLRRLCVETDIRREAWKFDCALAFTFAARCMVCTLAKDQTRTWSTEEIGPPLLVLKFLSKAAAMAYRGQLDQESLNTAVGILLKTYAERSVLAALLVEQGLRLVDIEYAGPQVNAFSVGMFFLEAVAASGEKECAFKLLVISSLVAVAHTSVGWRRRQVVLLLSRLLCAGAAQRIPSSILDRRFADLAHCYRRQLVPEVESKSGTGDLLSMFLQAFVSLLHAANTNRAVALPLTDIPQEACLSNGVHNLISVFASAAKEMARHNTATTVILPRALTEGAQLDALPESWLRYGGANAEIIPVGSGVNIRGLWHGADDAPPNVRNSFQSNHSKDSAGGTWGRPASSLGVASLLLAGAGAKQRVESFNNFPTVISDVSVGIGSWYWELEIENCSLMQVGWADPKQFTCDSEGGHGVGDDLHSWAYDGMRACIWHARKSEPYAVNDATDTRSSRDYDTNRRRRAAERRKRKRQKARRKRRLQNQANTAPPPRPSGNAPTPTQASSSSSAPLPHADISGGGVTSDGQWDEGDDASTEGEWVGDDAALLSCDGADDGDSLLFDDDTVHGAEQGGWRTGDTIGCSITITPDRTAEMTFNHNGLDLGTAFKNIPIGVCGLAPAASLRSSDNVVINLGGSPFRHCPPGHRGVADNLSWLGNALACDVTPGEQCSKKALEDLCMAYTESWCKGTGQGPTDVSCGGDERKNAPLCDDDATVLSAAKEGNAATAYTVLSRFNVLARLLLAFVGPEAAMSPSLGSAGVLPGQHETLTGLYMQARNCLFPWAKDPLVDGILAASCREGRIASILLSRNYFAQGGRGGSAPESLFDQLHALYRNKRPWAFRSYESCDASARLWTVVFEGEAAEDAGGPFRESLATVCEELMEESAQSLFIFSPNHKGNFGDTRDKRIPRPAGECGAVERAMLISKFRFLGRLMAGCLTINEPMNVSLSSVVWKHLTRTSNDRADLAAIDQMCLTALDGIINIDTKGVVPELFKDAIDETFVTTLSDGQLVDLLEGGHNKEVTFENREEYAGLVIDKRLHEAELYLESMRLGMTDVIPEAVLSLYSWRVLERKVCGASGISVAELKASALYEDIDEYGDTVQRFWDAIEHFAQADLTNLLRFVAARSRLPVAIKLQPYHVDGDPDKYLPQAHTCFFSLELPDYSSTEVMKARLMYAIYNCRAIDTDGAPVGLEDMDAEDDDEVCVFFKGEIWGFFFSFFFLVSMERDV